MWRNLRSPGAGAWRCASTLIVGAVLIANGPAARARTASDQEGSVAQWSERTRVAREWLKGGDADRWAKRVRYDGPPIELRFSAHNPGDASVVRDVFIPAFDVLRRMSGNKLTVKATWGGSTHSLAQGWDALARGDTDMTACYASLEAETRGFQLLTLLDLPGLFPNATVGTIVSERLYEKYLRADFARNGVRIARMKATGPNLVFTRDSVSGIGGLKGLSIFSAEGVQGEAVVAVGANPVVMETPRIRAAIANGSLDGAAITDAAAAVYGINRVAPHLLAADVGRTNLEYCLSPSFYAGLPADLRMVLNAWLRAEGVAEAQIFYGVNGAAARQDYLASGGRVTKLTPEEQLRWAAELTKVERSAVDRLAKMGLPARAFMADLRRWTRRYSAMSENEIMAEAIRRPIRRTDD